MGSHTDQNIRCACDCLEEELPQAVVFPCEGTHLSRVDVCVYYPDERQLEKRMRQQSLILDEGHLSSAQGRGSKRISIVAPRSLIEKHMRRFAGAVSGEVVE